MSKPKILLLSRIIANTLMLFFLANALNDAYDSSERGLQFYLMAGIGVSAYALLMFGAFKTYQHAGSSSKPPTPVNPIAEADVFLAYGRKDQAAQVLREALKLDPENGELRAKLESLEKPTSSR